MLFGATLNEDYRYHIQEPDFIIDISVMYLYFLLLYSGNKQSVSKIGSKSSARREKPWRLHSVT
jgi:hypothetical protein